MTSWRLIAPTGGPRYLSTLVYKTIIPSSRCSLSPSLSAPSWCCVTTAGQATATAAVARYNLRNFRSSCSFSTSTTSSSSSSSSSHGSSSGANHPTISNNNDDGAAAAADDDDTCFDDRKYGGGSAPSMEMQYDADQYPAWNKFPDGSRFWKQVDARHAQRPIFVAATRQHVGKTTVSLAIMSGLKKRFDKVGFLKPVGQQHVEVKSSSNNTTKTLQVDKDVCLVREHFHLDHIDYEHMSPVIIPQGYTRKFVDGEVKLENQVQDVLVAMEHIARASDIVLVEGTGHCAVGSIVGLNNAKVASLIGADMVLVANGGLGSAFDELEQNRILCQHYNVRVAGVIINKVIRDKLEQTEQYMRKAMMQAWGIPLLACIPDRPFLGCPALADLEQLFKTKLISGAEHRFRHYNISDINLVTTSMTRFLENLRQKPSRTLYICHVTRDDLIVAFLGEYQRRKEQSENERLEAALVVCGRKDKYDLNPEVADMLAAARGAPVMVVNLSTRDAMEKIHKFTPKLNIHDTNRVNVAVEHYEPYIDFDELLRRTRSDNSSFNEPGYVSFNRLRQL